MMQISHYAAMAKAPSGDTLRKALKRFMDSRDLKPKPWSERAGLTTPNALYNFLNGRSDSLSRRTLEMLAEAEHVQIGQLTGDSALLTPQSLRMIPLVGRARAGEWLDAECSALDEGEGVPFPNEDHPQFPGADIVAIKVDGDSMDQYAPSGSYVAMICVHDVEVPTDFLNNRVVFVRHTRSDGFVEHTLKRLKIADGKRWLVAESSNPRWQGAIEIEQNGEEDQYEIVAFAVRRISAWE